MKSKGRRIMLSTVNCNFCGGQTYLVNQRFSASVNCSVCRQTGGFVKNKEQPRFRIGQDYSQKSIDDMCKRAVDNWNKGACPFNQAKVIVHSGVDYAKQ